MHADVLTSESPPRIRVLCLLASLIGGGAERQMLLLLQHLDRRRFEPTLCVLADGGPFRADVPPDVPLLSLRKTSPADALRLVVRLARLLRSLQPDVVLSKANYTNGIVAAAELVGRARIPLIVGEECVQSEALKDLSHPALRRALIRWAYGRAAHVTAPSEGVLNELSGSFGIRGPAFTAIPNMVDVAAIEDAAAVSAVHPFRDSSLPLLVTAGRLAPAKGQADLLAALRLLSDEHPCNLLVLGEGQDAERLRTLARDLDVEGHVAFLGFVSNPFALMAQADVFVSPSHSESFGNVIIEAMAVGVPVVSTRLRHGPETIIRDGETGLFCRAKDPADLTQKILDLIRDRRAAAEMARQAKTRVAQYDIGAVVPLYEQLLSQAATEHAG